MGRDATKAQYKRLMGYTQEDYVHLMSLGRGVLNAEEVFGQGSPQHARAVGAWRAQQQKMGVAQ